MKKLTLFLLLFASALVLSAVESATPGWDLYPTDRVSPEHMVQFKIVKSLAVSNDMGLKLKALEETAVLSEEELNDQERFILSDIIGEVGLKGTGILVVNDGQLQVQLMQLRHESARQLGVVGGEESARVLLKMMRSDLSPVVLAQCASSAAQIIPTLEPGDQADQLEQLLIEEMVDSLIAQNRSDRDGIYAMGFLEALDHLGEYKKEILYNPQVVEQLIALADATTGYNRLIRTKAWEILDKI